MKALLRPFFILLPLLLSLSVMNSCHKEQFSTHGALSFSGDTLTFDTVFTTLGSTTMSFMVRNTQSKSVNVSDIKLLGLAGSQFRIAIPPYPNGTEFKNIDIPAHDSIYVFVEVTINPNSANNPFIVTDKVQFITNGITQNVVLEAMGQNAYYHFSDSIRRDTMWKNDKPHIIVNRNGGLPILEVPQGVTLTLQPNTHIYMGPNAVITVDGNLVAQGHDWADSITFQYIRTDYPNQGGQYLGITYSRTAGITMDHVIIDQSTFGLSDEYVLDLLAQSQITTSVLTNYASNATPTVTLNNVIIRNAASTALTAIRTNLTATNCAFYSSSGQMVLLGMGGGYTLNNCTLANAYNQYSSSQSPILTIVDAIPYLNSAPLVGPFATMVNISNSIIAGNTAQNGDVLGFNLRQASSDAITFKYNLLTENQDSLLIYQPSAVADSNIFIGDPQYLQPALWMSPQNNNYMPDSASIVQGRANSAASPKDLYDFTRPNPASIGAIEWRH